MICLHSRHTNNQWGNLPMKPGQTHRCQCNLQVDSRAHMRQTLSSPALEGAPRLVDPDAARPERRTPRNLMLLARLHARAMLVVFPRAPGHPFEPKSLRRHRSPSPAAAKLLARQQGPWHCILGHRYAASNRAGLRCVVSPCPRPRPRGARSRGGWARRLGEFASPRLQQV